MKSNIGYWLQSWNQDAKLCLAYSRTHLRVYAIIGLFSPLVTIVDYQIANTDFNTLSIRLLTALLCSPLLAVGRLPSLFQEFFHLYFAFACAVIFPFGYGVMLVLNAGLAAYGTEIHMQWILQYFIGLFIFIQVIPRRQLALILWIIASIAALIPLLFISDPNTIELERVLLYTVPAFVTAVALGILTNRHKDMLDAERFKAAWAIGANAAHELRTPLATIKVLSGASNQLIPMLVDSYEKARDAGLDVEPLRPRQIEELRKVLTSIQDEVQYSNTIIDMILVNTAENPTGAPDSTTFSVRDCIEEAVARYPFNNSTEKQLVAVRINADFDMTAPRLLVVHILFNLIKNGLRFVQRKRGAIVEISAMQDDESSRIIVHDTGPGISSYNIPHVFERFYTTSNTGESAGIGLSFCKMVMERVGGDIECDSVEGEFTTFTLTFPHPDPHLQADPDPTAQPMQS